MPTGHQSEKLIISRVLSHCSHTMSCFIGRWIQNSLILFHFFPPPSQIQQLSDKISADIDKQLAAKTKELLGWLWPFLFFFFFLLYHSGGAEPADGHTKTEATCHCYHVSNKQWLNHGEEVVWKRTVFLIPAHIPGKDLLLAAGWYLSLTVNE